MLEFLPMISAGLQGMSALSAMSNTAKGYQPTQAENAQLQAMADRERLLKAYLNPNDVIMKNLTAGENQTLNAQTQQQLSNLLAANRQAQLRGRQTYFNPERQDESISQFLTTQGDANATTARSNALQRILSAANGYSTNASTYGSMIPNQRTAQNVNSARLPTLLGSAADALKSGGSLSNIFNMMGQGGAGAPTGNISDLGTAMPWLKDGGAA